MPKTRIDEAAGLTVADVIHKRFSALPASATIGEVRDWFAVSTSRRMAFLADDGRFAGSLTPEDLAGEELDPEIAAADVAMLWPTVPPGAPAAAGERLAMLTPARRVPVVDEAGWLLGVVSVSSDLETFCGTD